MNVINDYRFNMKATYLIAECDNLVAYALESSSTPAMQ